MTEAKNSRTFYMIYDMKEMCPKARREGETGNTYDLESVYTECDEKD